MDDFGSKLFEVADIITNILSRLPVKSLIICKSVSKHWRSLICSPNFMRLQLLRSKEYPTYLFFPYTHWGRKVHFLTKTDGETTETLPGCDGYRFKDMICSFNGLICCINCEGLIFCKRTRTTGRLEIRIYNPATREVLLLPRGRNLGEEPKIGVAFGPRINGYKVFRFFCTTGETQDKHNECEVYSSITGSWKGIGRVAHSPWGSSKHVCINGIVYWFVRSEKDGLTVGFILAVDVEENFSVINIPEEKTLHPCLVNLEGHLSLVAANGVDKDRFDIWVLYDSKESIWVKKWSDYMPIFNIKQVNYVAVRKNEILFGSVKHYLFYNMVTRTWRELNWGHSCRDRFSFPMTYTESLLPCKY
ncbi:hypothetical protein PVL29_025585 [Vitis rotundifolia]|uniref:F-box domain-containing protein n=1 Tax=Vitis rotundifolia TaxID=103349 RepID=A0AA38YK83_VITRO|nr:hypothetical protein PVL29_025585 [Vitis rotundifolia]